MGYRWRMTVRMMLVAMVAGGVMYCSERINDPLGPAVKPGNTSFVVTNNSSFTIDSLFFFSSDSSTWGPERLGATNLSSYGSFTITQLWPGSWDLKAVPLGTSGRRFQKGPIILTSGTNSFTLTDTNFNTGILKVYNGTNFTFHRIYRRLSGSSSWGANRIPVGDSLEYDWTQTSSYVPTGTYDLRAENASGTQYVETTGVRILFNDTTYWRPSTPALVTPAPTGQVYSRYSYVANASLGVAYAKSVQKIDTLHDCNVTDQLVTVYDTMESESDTLSYVVSGNQLTLEDWTDVSFTDLSAAVTYNMILTRQGTGTGVAGLWQVANYTQTRLAGTLTLSEQQSSDTATAVTRNMMLQTQWQVLITADTIRQYYSPSGLPAACARTAGAYLLAWGGYAVTVTYPSATSLSVYGILTGETATLQYQMVSTRMFDWNIRYSSSNSLNLSQTYYNNPSFCPNDYPVWYTNFLTNNTALRKQAVVQSKRVGGVARVLLQ